MSLKNNIRRSLIKTLHNNKESKAFKKFFTFSLEELKEKLSSLFDEQMTWENFGAYWGIDFIIHPKHYRFQKSVGFEFNKCYSIHNIRPLSLKEIRQKQGRLLWEEVERYGVAELLPLGNIHLLHLKETNED